MCGEQARAPPPGSLAVAVAAVECQAASCAGVRRRRTGHTPGIPATPPLSASLSLSLAWRLRYHTEVLAVAVFHFVKLRHNVTVFTRDDPLHMGDVLHPYFWKGFR